MYSLDVASAGGAGGLPPPSAPCLSVKPKESDDVKAASARLRGFRRVTASCCETPCIQADREKEEADYMERYREGETASL